MCIVDNYDFRQLLDKCFDNLLEVLSNLCTEKSDGVIFSKNWFSQIKKMILKNTDEVVSIQDSLSI